MCRRLAPRMRAASATLSGCPVRPARVTALSSAMGTLAMRGKRLWSSVKKKSWEENVAAAEEFGFRGIVYNAKVSPSAVLARALAERGVPEALSE